MAVWFTMEALGTVQVNRVFDRLVNTARDTSGLWGKVAEKTALIEQVQFLTEGAHGSGGWAPLKDSTLKEKRRKGQPSWILRASEKLYDDMTNAGNYEAGSDWMKFPANVDPIAYYHQYGTRKMKRRPVVQLTETDRVELTKMVQRFLITGALS